MTAELITYTWNTELEIYSFMFQLSNNYNNQCIVFRIQMDQETAIEFMKRSDLKTIQLQDLWNIARRNYDMGKIREGT